MKLEDVPTPETDAWIAKWDLWNSYSDWPNGLTGPISDVAHARMLEQRLALALAENARLKAAMDKYSEDEMLLFPSVEDVTRKALDKHQYIIPTIPDRRKGERRDPPYYGESARWLNPLAWERTGKDRRQK